MANFKLEIQQSQLLGVNTYLTKCRERDVDLNELDDHGYSRLHYAVYDQQLELIEALIKNGAEVNIESRVKNVDKGFTPLQIALYPSVMDYPTAKGHSVQFFPAHQRVSFPVKGIVEHLIKNNADLNIHNNSFYSPLKTVMMTGNYDLAVKLMKNGANPFQGESEGEGEGENLLHVAFNYNNSSLKYYDDNSFNKLVKALLNIGVDPTLENLLRFSPIENAIWNYNPTLYIQDTEGRSLFNTMLTKAFPRVLYDTVENLFYNDEGNLIHFATEWGNLDAINALVEYGVSISVKDKNGRTPKEIAIMLQQDTVVAYLDAEEAHSKTVKQLLKEETLGFDVEEDWNAAMSHHESKIAKIMETYHQEILNIIEYNMQESLSLDSLSDYQFLVSTMYGQIHDIEQYLETGYDVNVSGQETEYLTPLENAIALHQPEIAKLIVNYDAKLDFTHSEESLKSDSLLIQAMSTLEESPAKSDLISAMIAHGANVNAVDQFGMTPLMTAVLKNEVASIQKLMEISKIDLDYQDPASNMTALLIAKNHHLNDIEKILLSDVITDASETSLLENMLGASSIKPLTQSSEQAHQINIQLHHPSELAMIVTDVA